MKSKYEQLVKILQAGGVAVLRTDTLYGIVARADDEQAVARVYAAKGRDAHKSCIVLVADASQAYGDISAITHEHGEPTSILVESPAAPTWLLRENSLIAHRIPSVKWLREVIATTGPLIAPSANPEGLPPAMTVSAAREYFGDAVDVYVDGGTVPEDTPASRLIHIHDDGSVERLR